MRLTVAFALLFSILFRSVSADEFINPSNSKSDLAEQYTLGQTVQLKWNTTLDEITLLVSHWGGNAVGSLLSDALNPSVYTWTIGHNDNIDDDQIAKSGNFVLLLRDPSGTTGTGAGFVNGQLSSRAFVVRSNTTSSSSTSSTSSSSSSSSSSSTTTFSSLLSSSATSSLISTTTTTTLPATTSSTSASLPPTASTTSAGPGQSMSSAADSSPGLTLAAKAEIGVAAGVAGVGLMAVGVLLAICCNKRHGRTDNENQGTKCSNPPNPTTSRDLYEFDGAASVLPLRQPLQSYCKMADTTWKHPYASTMVIQELGSGRNSASVHRE